MTGQELLRLARTDFAGFSAAFDARVDADTELLFREFTSDASLGPDKAATRKFVMRQVAAAIALVDVGREVETSALREIEQRLAVIERDLGIVPK